MISERTDQMKRCWVWSKPLEPNPWNWWWWWWWWWIWWSL